MITMSLICATTTRPRIITILSLLSLIFSFTYAVPDTYEYLGQSQFGIIADKGPIDQPIAYDYPRQEHACQSVLATASHLEQDGNRMYTIQNELSFVNGDWDQSPGNAPLMPYTKPSLSSASNFSSHYNYYNSTRSDYIHHSPIPLKLASFWITHVDTSRRKGFKNNYVSVSGVMVMGITSDLDGTLMNRPYDQNPAFRSWPGHSELSIYFQGLYVESAEEKVLCLLGNALLPSRQRDSTSDPVDHQPSLLQDDQILLFLHYPKTITLTNLVIRGELKSLNTKDSPKYFDDAHVISYMSYSFSTKYVSSNNILSKACKSSQYGDSCNATATDVYKQTDFCSLIAQFSQGKAFNVVPNWKCNGTDEFCSRLGPFIGNKEINATDGSFKDVGIFMQTVRCEQTTSQDDVTSAKLLAIFRAVSLLDNPYYVSTRSGLNNMTVVSEGVWSSSNGHLCMIACLGIVSSEDNCNSRVCLYIPLSFTVKQRSILVGTIASLNSSAKPYSSLSFEKLVQPYELGQLQTTMFQYKYSKIKEAGSLLEKDQAFSFGNIIKKSTMKFPKLDNAMSYMASISDLSEDLRIQRSAMPNPTPASRIPRIDILMDIVSIGSVLAAGQGGAWAWAPQSVSVSTADEDVPDLPRTEYTERQILLNVSAQLTISSKTYSNLSVIFLEGIYDPHVGKMYLIGCRDVRASWKILYESKDLEAGLDCQVEVVVSYPPTTVRWFMNPTAVISISSKRNDDDPLHFPEVKLRTLPIFYRMQREDILSHRGVEGILRILTLTMTLTFVLSQLIYMRQTVESVPFISLVMLGVQVLGYSLHLITGAEAILGGMASKSSYHNQSDVLEKTIWLKLIDYCVKLLVLVSFLLTLRLCQKVWKYRTRLLSHAPLEPHGVPSDRRVMIIMFITHLVGYITIVFVHASKSNKKHLGFERSIDYGRNRSQTNGWDTQLEEYVGLVQDFFLLPQIIGNLIWQTQSKPLRKLYYIGITVIRVLPHVYDYVREPIPSPYFSEDREFVNPAFDFYSTLGDILIPTVAFIFTLVVYIQQRWGYEKIAETLTICQLRLLPTATRAYQRLPTKTGETELVSGTGNNSDHQERNNTE